MAVVWAQIVAIAPELACVPVASQNAILAQTTAMLAPSQWGTKHDLAVTLLAAHFGALFVRGSSNPGAVTSEAVSGVSVGYASPPVFDRGLLNSTSYGSRFRLLQRGCGFSVGFVA